MARNVAEAVRAAYEERPYPVVTKETLRRPPWRLPTLDWIQAVAQPAQFPPRRILVAGCGTGAEAFALRCRFSKAEIVAVDFAARSIALAQRWQKRSARSWSIRFIRADLTSNRLRKISGGNFDFISCHGVMSYLPAPERALHNLANCLASDGILYLGVNGAAHFSSTWRNFLSAFGFEMERWPGGERLWRHLKLVASLTGDEDREILGHGAGYLASDLFGPIIRNLVLRDWVRMSERAGLHFRGSDGNQRRRLWPAINDGSIELFLPRSRAEVAMLLDVLGPASFYRLIFSRTPAAIVPWQNHAALMKCRPLRTDHLRHFKWPQRQGARLFKLENRSANISLELRGAGWEIDLLRESNGERSLQEILPRVRRPGPAALRAQLYLFYLLDLLNFLPPAPAAKREMALAQNGLRRAVSNSVASRSPRET